MQSIMKERLFSVLQRGDRKIKRAQRKAIIFVGLTRVGKSTAFKWALKKQMKGVGNLKSYYVDLVADENVAPSSQSFASVTLDPNIYINFEEGTSLIDMAGYEDTRDYIGVIGVSYFLKALFEQVREVKFVIVMDQNKLMQTTCEGLIKTFNGFINMFNFDIMKPQIKQNLINSLTLLITRSRQGHLHYDYIDDIIRELGNPLLIAENKQLIIQLLQQLRGSARVEAFQAARNDQNPQQCTFIRRFTDARGWKQFDFQANQAILNGQCLINLPFTRDYEKLNSVQQNNFIRDIEEKIASYLGFANIIRSLVDNYKANWESCLQQWKVTREFRPNSFTMSQMFKEVAGFVERNDVYNSKTGIQTAFRVSYDPPTFIQSIKILLDIQQTVTEISQNAHNLGNGEHEFKEAMNVFNHQFTKVTKKMKVFCQSQQEEQLIQKVEYILCRGFRQFQKLYQLKAQLMAGARQGLTDTCNGVFDESLIVYVQKIIKEINSELLGKIFSNLPLLDEYSTFLDFFSKLFQENSRELTEQNRKQNETILNKQKYYVQIAKADFLGNEGKKIEALNCYINAFQKTTQINGDSREIFMIKLKLVKKIVNILKKVPKAADLDLKNYALQLCLKYKLIEETGQIYSAMVDSASVPQQIVILEDYAKFSAQWGKVEKALDLLQKKLSLIDESHDDFLNTLALMKDILGSRERYWNSLSGKISEIEHIQERDSSVAELLQVVKANIAQLKDQE